MWLIYACLFLVATARTFQGPPRSALLPNSVPPELLRNAITWNSSANEIAASADQRWPGSCSLFSAAGAFTRFRVYAQWAHSLCYYSLNVPHVRPRQGTPAPTLRSLLQGIVFVWREKLVLVRDVSRYVRCPVRRRDHSPPIYAVEILHTGARGLGWLRAAPSVGAVAMALLLAHRMRIERAGAVLLSSVAAFGVATMIFGASRSFWLSLGMLILVGAFDNVSVVLRQSLIQSETPDAIRGRVLAVNNIFISCSNQLGASNRVGPRRGWARFRV